MFTVPTYSAQLSDGMEQLQNRERPLARGIRISYLGFRTSTDAGVPTAETTASIFPSVRTQSHLIFGERPGSEAASQRVPPSKSGAPVQNSGLRLRPLSPSGF